MNHLTLDEFNLIYDGYFEGYKNDWEKVRLTCFALAQYRKNSSLQEYMPFAWDKLPDSSDLQSSTKEDFEAMKELLTKLNIITHG